MLNKPKNNLDEIKEHLEAMQELDSNPEKWREHTATLQEWIDFCGKLARENEELQKRCSELIEQNKFLENEYQKTRETLYALMKDKGERP